MNSQSKIIIYDDNCPLCAAYTNLFIHTGLIKKQDRKNFSNVEPEWMALVDIKRWANEIPVIDSSSHQVWYGIDALLEILGQKIPLIKVAGNIPPVKWLLHKLYKFISYNRRVIVAGIQAPGSYNCIPDFNFRYRLIFIMACSCFITGMLFPIQHYLIRTSISNNSIQQLVYAYFILVSVNIAIASKLGRMKCMEYFGQFTMVALIAVLLTIPIIILSKYLQIQNPGFNGFYMGMMAILLMNEYCRRIKFANITQHKAGVVFVNILSIAIFITYLIH